MISRRAALRGLLAAPLALGPPRVAAAASAHGDDHAVAVRTRPIVDFAPREPGRIRFGALDFLGGLELTADDPHFGSFSALRTRDHGRELLSVGDDGTWFWARLDGDDTGRPIGIAEARLARLRDGRGRPLRGKGNTDAESLELNDENGAVTALVGFERHHRLLRYRSTDGWRGLLAAAAQPVPEIPHDISTLGRNQGLEAIARAPRGSRLAGTLVLIGEEPRSGERDHPGWLVGGPTPGTFHVAHRDDFAVTDACFLPDGDLLILERRFSWIRGIAMRIRRLPAAALAPGRTVDGPVLVEADGGHQIDNMEGLAVDRGPDGTTILTLISDDNGSWLQRTVLLRFRLRDLA